MSMSHLSQVILDEVKANRAKLDGCQGHDFEPVTPGLFGTKYVCRHCQGMTDGVSVNWYKTGLAHALAAVQQVA